jgi:uncharacterized protein YndB with AHSA1/START domain
MAGMSDAPDRELTAEVRIAAPPEQVWTALTELDRMAARSPELVRMVPLGRGGLRAGQQYLGLNRRGPVVWPTRNRVVAVEAPHLLVWDTVSSGARWVFELHPDGPDGTATRVVQRRPVTRGLTLLSRAFAPLALGGSESHADELEEGMQVTLEALRTEVESEHRTP